MKRRDLLALLTAALGISSCASAPTHYYAFESAPNLWKPDSSSEVRSKELDVNCERTIGGVVVPALLDRPQIVVDRGANQVDILEQERWAEPLRDSIKRVLMNALRSNSIPSLAGADQAAGSGPRSIGISVELLQLKMNSRDVFITIKARLSSQSPAQTVIWYGDVHEAVEDQSGQVGMMVGATNRGLHKIANDLAVAADAECRRP